MACRDTVSCRGVLWGMILWGIGINYMLRVNPNIVIVAIVEPPESPISEVQCQTSMNNTPLILENEVKFSKTYKFDWNEHEQGLMLGAYYWLHWLTEVPGGVLTKKYGTKFVFGMGNLLAALLGLFLPMAIKYHPSANIAVRVLQGIVAGVAFPSTHDLTAKWIPENERSKFVSAYMGGGIAIAATYAISGYVINHLGWEAVFYITSAFGFIWYGFWLLLVYDSPSQHPRITREEKKYILENLDNSVESTTEVAPIPWREILTSGPVWVSILSNWSCVWGYYTLMTQAPAYFSFVHGWSIEKTGVLAGLPHFLTFLFSWIFGNICDWLLRTKKLTLTNVRKLATIVSTGGPGLMAIGLSYSGCNSTLAFSFMLSGITITGAVSSGPLANLVDLSPVYASILLGICGVIVDAAGFLSPIIVGLLTYENQTIGQWKLIFFISAVNMAIGSIIYTIWGSADEQLWNKGRTKITNEDKSMEKIELNSSD